MTTALTFTDVGLTNGETYPTALPATTWAATVRSRRRPRNPVAPPPAPSDVTATAGDHQVTVAWTPLPAPPPTTCTEHKAWNGETPIAPGIAGPPFVDTTAENGPTYYYTVIATNAGGSSPRSAEVSATPEGPPLVIEPETSSAYRLLRQSTWGPRPGDVDHVKDVGVEAFLNEQFAAPAVGVSEHAVRSAARDVAGALHAAGADRRPISFVSVSRGRFTRSGWCRGLKSTRPTPSSRTTAC